MEEGDEDKLLLSSLGISSANPEDIEREIISQAKCVANYVSEPDESSRQHEPDDETSLSTSRTRLCNKLRAIEVEIDAVASSVDRIKCITDNGNDTCDQNGDGGDKVEESAVNDVQCSNGLSLEQALVSDRLRSLKKAKAQLEKEISSFGDCAFDDIKHGKQTDKLLGELVRENQKKKKTIELSTRPSRRSLKAVSYNEDVDFDAALDASSSGFMETERDKLVRKGILTPFHKLKGFERRVQHPGTSTEQEASAECSVENLALTSIAKAAESMYQIASTRPTTKLLDADTLPALEPPTVPFQRLRAPLKHPRSLTEELDKKKRNLKRLKRPKPDKKWRKQDLSKQKSWSGCASNGDATSDYEGEMQVEAESMDESCVILEGGLKIPGAIFSKLFDYQKVGVQWLWELHCQRAGGIIGDEMGLGKTIQVVSFLASLHYSKLYKPSLVVCPVTLLRQWQREVQKWYPDFEVEILHDSAHFPSEQKTSKSSESDYDSESSIGSDNEKPRVAKPTKRWEDMIDRIVRSESGLLLTTYEQLRIMGRKLLDIEWGYSILDEGHRIRNPNAEITLICKQLQTVHRIIMSGAPIQNKLAELWSLFDFVFPGKLGVLPVFEMEFAVPITVGGYANATPLQVSTAYRCAVVLRDLVMPYLLRRMKADVNAHLPKKTEHVLFCSLTQEQRSVYRAFLASSEVEQIFDGRRNSLYGIDIMRKICNHPDLLEREHATGNPDYGNLERSGKMKVVSQVLKVWKEQGHRVLLFTQTQQMLDIFENFLAANGHSYRRMDGLTPIKQRMSLIDEFNNSGEVFIFILTTKVGGLGTNLTGADRVIIYDPDWNPSTDMQARERAWRIGQTRDVTVYRLITRGTIEEKVYHRQIYKHFLTNKILKNPQQRRFFKARDMKDLFTLQDDQQGNSTETSNIFSQLSEVVNLGGDICNHGKQESPSVGEEENTNQNNGCIDGETSILRSLLDANGIHSAVNHDAIMNASDDAKMKLEEQASQVAQRAAQALRESRMLRARESFAVPTWTGRSGAAGAPSSARSRFGSTFNTQLLSPTKPTEASTSRPNGFSAGAMAGKALSSAELLAKIRGTQETAITDALEQDLDLASSFSNQSRNLESSRSTKSSNRLMIVQPEVMIRQLCTFIQQRGGQSDSASITQHFKDRIQSKDLPLFKNLLKEIATLEKVSGGSRWVLKPEYR
ncbi:DNA excision repair protein CSB [Curcuma longa]|uniref:DNA excision repair protein CSB n=1 Tax=Curcuma longa TaxID=136217 RepID=UPI003D9E3C3A